MLTKLQSGVESEEAKWKTRLADKEAEVADRDAEMDKLKQQNRAMEESLKVVGQAEEVRTETKMERDSRNLRGENGALNQTRTLTRVVRQITRHLLRPFKKVTALLSPRLYFSSRHFLPIFTLPSFLPAP